LTRRLIVSWLVYLLSIPAIFTTIGLVADEVRGSNPSYLVLLAWPTAWCIHMLMSGAWVFDTRLPKWIVAIGCASGVASLLAIPLQHFANPAPEPGYAAFAAGVIAVQMLMLAPAFALAFATAKFHVKGP
jgi:hypothetical protein